jgi:hypothetical protein
VRREIWSRRRGLHQSWEVGNHGVQKSNQERLGICVGEDNNLEAFCNCSLVV